MSRPRSPENKVVSRRRLRAMLVVLAACLMLALILDRMFPLPLPAAGAGAATIVLARDGTPLRAFADAEGVWRYPVTVDEVSPLYVEALLGYEDRWFRHHPGVNPWAIVRAAWQWIRHGTIVSGGSTLTMQVARLIEPTPHTLHGKLRQTLRALQLEAHLDKDAILTLYLNHAPFGGTIEGVEAASWAWLGKPAARLSHAEAALLAVLPQAPSRLRPDRHPGRARSARDKVLQRLVDLGIWDAETAAAARIEPVLARSLATPMLAPILAERLRAELPREHRIRSTIELNMQRAVEARVTAYLARLPPRTSAAVLVMENRSGAVRAYVGSGEFGSVERLGYVDMVRAWRSPGSTLKPFLYGMALDDGLIHSASLLLDTPQSFGGYRPGDFGATFSGPVSAADALRLSLNVPAVELLDQVGPERFQARLAHAGLPLLLPPGARANLAVILGGAGARLEDLVGAYTALGNAGIATAPRLLEDAPLRQRRLLSPGAAWIIHRILADHPRPGFSHATVASGERPPLAWKTGTSYGFRDAWAVAGLPEYSLGVWVGRPDGTPMPGQYGAITALPLLFQIADSLPIGRSADAPMPPTVSEADICWPLGLAPDPAAPELCVRRHQAWILDGVIPPSFARPDSPRWSAAELELRVDAATGQRLSAGCHRSAERAVRIARWPVQAWPWLAATERRRASLPPLAAGCADDGLEDVPELRIEGIAAGSTLARAPNSKQPPRLSLRALGSNAPVRWLLNGRLVATTPPGVAFQRDYDEAGLMEVTALAEDAGWAAVSFRVAP